MPACCWISWQVTCALMRALARGPSGTLMQSMPASAHSCAPAISRDASTPRGGRISTNATNLPAASFAPELAISRATGTVASACALACGSSTVTVQLALPRLQRARFGADQLDVLRRGAAAAADRSSRPPTAGAARTAPCTPASTDRCCGPPPRTAGRRWAWRSCGLLVNCIIRSMVSSITFGPDRAVQPDHVDRPLVQSPREGLGIGAARQMAEIVDGDLRDRSTISPPAASRAAKTASRSSSRLPKVSRISRSTPASTSASICSRKVGARLGERGGPERLDAHAQRSDRAGDEGAVLAPPRAPAARRPG